MRRPLVAGNWKMNGDRAAARALANAIATAPDSGQAEVLLCPPSVHLVDVAAELENSRVALGAQNVSEQPSGAFTGEISCSMLLDAGCSHVIIGHSERRAIFGESEALAAEKAGVALAGGLIPVFCVGETLRQREAGETESVLARQLDPLFKLNADKDLGTAIIAYEPVWAIGTGKTASPEQAQAAHAFLRERIARHSAKLASDLRILYGGSVKADNAGQLFAMQDVDGGLVGGASLVAEQFLAIIKAAG